MEAAAKNHGTSVIQVALAWPLQRSPVMLPIPDTSSVAHLEENVAAAALKQLGRVASHDAMARPR
jgi:aryl-alcohol dehydrogenase-like predicted oxidoreductase